MSLWGLTDRQISKPTYLDRGQVIALNVTNAGSGYVAVPTVTIPAPTSGTQATATAKMTVKTVAINAGGTKWSVGDLFTVDLSDAAGTVEAVFEVTEATDGIVSAASLINGSEGLYTAITPVNLTGVAAVPVTVADEDAADLTVNLTLKIKSLTITNPGAGYVAADLTNGVVPITFNPNGTSAAASAVVAVHIPNHSQYTDSQIVFVDREESLIPDNRKRGLKSPGWWLYSTKTDSDGAERYLSELLVAADIAFAASGDSDSDDQEVPEGTISITLASTKNMADGATSNIVATVSVSPSIALTYKWQIYNGSWSNLSDATFYSGTATSTLVLTAVDYSLNSKRYRLKVTGSGLRTTYSNTVTLGISPAVISLTSDLAATRESVVGGTLGLEVTPAIVPAGLAITYLWETSADSGETWTTIPTPAPNGYYLTIPTEGTFTLDDDNSIYRVTLSRLGAISIQSTECTLTVTAE